MAPVPQVQPRQIFFRLPARDFFADPVITGLVHHDVETGLKHGKIDLLRHDAQIRLGIRQMLFGFQAEDLDAASVLGDQRGDNAYGG